jgi:cytochrome c oxidase subunit II
MNATQVISRQLTIFQVAGTALFLAIIATMVYFVIRYRRSRHPVAVEIPGNLLLEIVWIIVPTVLAVGMFFMGLRGYQLLRQVPEGAMSVKVEAFTYGWEFQYENGKKTQELYVPVRKPVRVELTSRDVIHSFFAPDFHVKEDVVPGMKTTAWFVVEEPGEHTILCAEYCGIGHSDMMSKIIAVPQERFDAWYADKAAPRP